MVRRRIELADHQIGGNSPEQTGKRQVSDDKSDHPARDRQ
jgi:hypothetical protein